jgi:hypothetical protein
MTNTTHKIGTFRYPYNPDIINRLPAITMKKYLLAFLTVLPFLFVSCAKKECCVIQEINDFIIADKNGVKWAIEPANSNITGDTTTIAGNQTTGDEEEAIGFKLSIGGIGYYPLKNHQGYYVIKKAGVITKKYTLSPTHLNSVTIISINTSNNIIQGFFDLKFNKIYDNSPGAQADSIGFLNGKFKVRLQN